MDAPSNEQILLLASLPIIAAAIILLTRWLVGEEQRHALLRTGRCVVSTVTVTCLALESLYGLGAGSLLIWEDVFNRRDPETERGVLFLIGVVFFVFGLVCAALLVRVFRVLTKDVRVLRSGVKPRP